MKFPAAALGLALLALTTISAADEPKDPAQNDAIETARKAITGFIIKPMSHVVALN